MNESVSETFRVSVSFALSHLSMPSSLKCSLPGHIQANDVPRAAGKRALVITKSPGNVIGTQQEKIDDAGLPRTFPDGKRYLPLIGMVHALTYKLMVSRRLWTSPHYGHHRLTPIDYLKMKNQRPKGFLNAAFTIASIHGHRLNAKHDGEVAMMAVVHCYQTTEEGCEQAAQFAMERIKLADKHYRELLDFHRLKHLYRARFVVRFRSPYDELDNCSYTSKPSDIHPAATNFMDARLYEYDVAGKQKNPPYAPSKYRREHIDAYQLSNNREYDF